VILNDHILIISDITSERFHKQEDFFMIKRRDFIKLGGLLASGVFYSHGLSLVTHDHAKMPDATQRVNFVYDGSALTAAEYADLLMKMADEGKIKEDYYSNGGIVEELENKFAGWLGKERAVFMPTGTLANHIAIRMLAGDNCRVIVESLEYDTVSQRPGQFYRRRDCGNYSENGFGPGCYACRCYFC
jgi:hypothetical protein